ncbi:hypothetical protein D9M70_416070 [compost metagenome]
MDPRVLDVAVVDAEVEALADEHLGQLHQRALAQVVGTGLEAQAEQADLALVVAADQLEGVLHLDHVAAHQRADQRRLDVQAGGAVVQRAHVLGQARAAEGEAGVQVVLGEVELVVLADHVHHLAAVDADRLGDVADLVGEGDLGGVPDVAGVLDHLRHLDALAHDGGVEFLVERLQQVAGAAVQLADHGHRRVVVVLDRGALAKELGVHRDAEVDPGTFARAFLEDRDHHVLHRARQHGGAHHHGMPGVLVAQRLADLGAHRLDEVQGQVAVALARRADAGKRQVGIANRCLDVGRAPQVAALHALLEQGLEPRLDDRRATAVDEVDLDLGYIDPDHLVAAYRQAPRAHRPHVTQTKNADAHDSLPE